MKAKWLVSVVVGVGAAACAAGPFDGWVVTGAVQNKGEPVPQLRVAADGAHITFDRAKMANRAATWGGIAPAVGKGPELVPGGDVRVTYRYPANGIVRCAGTLWAVDAEGEEFGFSPVAVTRLDERVVVRYAVKEGGWQGAFFAGRPRAGSTGGRNRNECFDLPLRLKGVAVGLNADVASGEVVVESVTCGGEPTAGRTARVREPVLAFERDRDRFVGAGEFECRDGRLRVASTNRCVWTRYAAFPGMKPFPAVEEIVLRTSTNWGGVVCLNLVDPATGQRGRLKAPWLNETRFATNMAPGRVWQLDGMEFWPQADKRRGVPKTAFTVDALEGVYRTTGAGACRLDVETGNALHVMRNERERPTLTLRNVSSAAQTWRGVLHCRDYFNRGFDEKVDATARPGETLRIPLRQPTGKGIWRVFGEIAAADGSKAFPETRFAVLDEHPRTPRLKRGEAFRPGINWHAARFTPKDRALCEDALEACGCKLVRAGGFAFSGIERREGVCDWTEADAIMAETEARGISLDAIVYSPPRWSQDTNRVARAKHFKKGMAPSRPGAFGAFAEKVAARYGERIDYYEIGNEWDLVPEQIMSRDEAVRVHREGYAGLKRGCPAANVIPNGWTGPDVRPDHYGKDPEVRVGGDYQAYVMERIRDACDGYPVHMHGNFRDYRRRVRRFLELRRRIGCDDLPWFSNETAASSVNGQEDEVAKFVFQKIMHAWANGSVDYIWYNLKATGWVANDPEQGYGMLTADFYPRASFAAFSAFTAVYLGLAFDGTVIDRATRLVHRFKGERDGRRVLVLGGWDSAAVEPCRIRIATDAARVWNVDLMGNREELKATGGEVAWPLSAVPGSVVFESATFARPRAEDLNAIATPPDAVIEVPPPKPGRAPDARLRTADRMTDYHQAIPETRHRLWQGPQDLSADVWFERLGDDLRVVAEVTDDVHAAGDAVEAEVCVPGGKPRKMTVPQVSVKGACRRHEGVFRGADCGFDAARLREGVSFTLWVREDDGAGEDGYLSLTDESDPPKLIRLR